MNYFVYLFGLLAVLSAAFKPFLIISFLIIIHEIGHFIVAKTLKVEVDKIYLYPLGGISKFFLPLNSSFTKEILILIAGPITQIIGATILIKLFPNDYEIILNYNRGILIFNLLPIYPLDGGKLIQLIISKLLPFKTSLKSSIIISYIMVFFYFLLNYNNLNISVVLIIIFLICKITEEKSKISYTYEKFILERYLNNYNFKKSKLITNDKNFYKNKRHLIKKDGIYYLEKEYLEKKYKKTQKNVDNKKSAML